MNELDVYRCAKLLLDRRGQDADLHAAMSVDELGAAGDDAGKQAWLRILAPGDELSRVARRGSEMLQ